MLHDDWLDDQFKQHPQKQSQFQVQLVLLYLAGLQAKEIGSVRLEKVMEGDGGGR